MLRQPRALASAKGRGYFRPCASRAGGHRRELGGGLRRSPAGGRSSRKRSRPRSWHAAAARASLLLCARGNRAAPPNRGRGMTILIAGIGNIFLGDDAFGVEVA